MNQVSFDFELTDFEDATAQQLVSYRIGKKKNESEESVCLRIEKMVNSDKFKDEVRFMVCRWNKARIKLNLKPW